MLSYVRSLRGTYKTAMLSNVGRGSVERLFTSAELHELFDATILSSEVGVTKPMAKAYEIAATQLGFSPEECLMIDDIVVNVEGARAAGMHAVLFESERQCKADIAELLGVHSA
jgi:putative hydrolase of the HAD superfamily